MEWRKYARSHTSPWHVLDPAETEEVLHAFRSSERSKGEDTLSSENDWMPETGSWWCAKRHFFLLNCYDCYIISIINHTRTVNCSSLIKSVSPSFSFFHFRTLHMKRYVINVSRKLKIIPTQKHCAITSHCNKHSYVTSISRCNNHFTICWYKYIFNTLCL